MIAGCFLVAGSPTVFYNYLTLLLFELGRSKFIFHAYLYSSNLIVVVILTIRKGYKDCTFHQFSPELIVNDVQLHLVRLGTPFLRVIYRDSKQVYSHQKFI